MKSDWIQVFCRKWHLGTRAGIPNLKAQGKLLRDGVRLLSESKKDLLKGNSRGRYHLSEQPFDLHLLNASQLYRKSRKFYFDQGGKFLSAFVSSGRALSSSSLLDQLIEYTPIESELIWRSTDPIESKNPDQLLSLRTYCTSLYHEQNHRILWKNLPPAPRESSAQRRYLNFAESLVVILDMALADQLDSPLALFFYLAGVTYDPGTRIRNELKSGRAYRNYLQACLHTTYLMLELYDPAELPPLIRRLFPNLGEYVNRAVLRSSHLDQAFIQNTNIRWQQKHRKVIVQKLTQSRDQDVLCLTSDPLDHTRQYLIAEKVFDLYGL